MNFKSHLAVGVLTGAGITFLAVKTGADIYKTIVPVTMVSALFSIFPDLDTSSIPQRWFYRLLITAMLLLGAYNEFEYATLLGIIALTPVIDQHRGWTHSWYAAFLVPLLIFIIYYFFITRDQFFNSFELSSILEYLIEKRWILFASIGGFSSHLILDSKWAFKNSKGHL